MSNVFDDTMKSAADSFFLLPGAEWITYRPRTGSARRIRAVVTRSEWIALPGVEGGSRPPFKVLVKNDVTNGIDSATVDTGGDELNIAPNVGEPPKAFRLAEIMSHDAGLMFLKVQ